MNELVINFHGIGEPSNRIDRQERRFWWDKTAFISTLDAISTMRVNSDTLIHITFDDGNVSDAEIAFPALMERKLKASFFICVGRIGNLEYLDKSAIKYLAESGMNIGSHGMHHIDWRRASKAELDREIVDSKLALEDVCGCTIADAAIPFGSYDHRVLMALKGADYRHVYTSDGGLASNNKWKKPRNTLDRTWQNRNISDLLTISNSPIGRLIRSIHGFYKSKR